MSTDLREVLQCLEKALATLARTFSLLRRLLALSHLRIDHNLLTYLHGETLLHGALDGDPVLVDHHHPLHLLPALPPRVTLCKSFQIKFNLFSILHLKLLHILLQTFLRDFLHIDYCELC